jgi:hypothetical protein
MGNTASAKPMFNYVNKEHKSRQSISQPNHGSDNGIIVPVLVLVGLVVLMVMLVVSVLKVMGHLSNVTLNFLFFFIQKTDEYSSDIECVPFLYFFNILNILTKLA